MKAAKRILLALAFIFLMHGTSSAVNISPNCGAGSQDGKPAICGQLSGGASSGNPIIHTISLAISIISVIIGIAAVFGIVIGALRITASGGSGDGKSAAAGRKSVIYSLIGLAVAILAQTIVSFVLNKVK